MSNLTVQVQAQRATVTLTRPDLQKLLVQIRRATTADQLEVLEWLRKKFKAS